MKRILSILSVVSLCLASGASLQAQEYAGVHEDCVVNNYQLNYDELQGCVQQLTDALAVKQQELINAADLLIVNQSDPKMAPDESDPKMIDESSWSDPKMAPLSDPKMIYNK